MLAPTVLLLCYAAAAPHQEKKKKKKLYAGTAAETFSRIVSNTIVLYNRLS